MIQNQDFVVVNLTYSIMISLKIHIYAEVIYPRFMKRALLNKKAIDYLSIRNLLISKTSCTCTIFVHVSRSKSHYAL